MRLLLVEDNDRLRELLSDSLRDAGYAIDAVARAAEFRAAAASIAYDAFIIDLGLPDEDGLALIRSLRRNADSTPVLVITARGAVWDKIEGLDTGADDYLVKPFNHHELIARVRAILRRPSIAVEPELTLGRVVLNEAKAQAVVGDEKLELRPKEFRLLAMMMRRPERTITKAEIEEKLTEQGKEITANAVEALVSRLRRALTTADTRLEIETLRSLGYQLKELP